MSGVNKVILLGRLGADPETRHTANGSCVTSLRLATSEKWRDKETGEAQERTEWHSVTLFGRLGEVAGEYLRKGSQAYIEGSLRTDKYTDKEGVERYTTEIVAENMQMLGGRDDGERTAPPAQRQAPKPAARSSADAFADMPDDVPF